MLERVGRRPRPGRAVRDHRPRPPPGRHRPHRQRRAGAGGAHRHDRGVGAGPRPRGRGAAGASPLWAGTPGPVERRAPRRRARLGRRHPAHRPRSRPGGRRRHARPAGRPPQLPRRRRRGRPGPRGPAPARHRRHGLGGLAPGANRFVVGADVHADGAVGVLLAPDPAGHDRRVPGLPAHRRPLRGHQGRGQRRGRDRRDARRWTAWTSCSGASATASASWCSRACTSAGSSTSTRPTSGRGDFLVRNVIGADRASGAIAIGDVVPVGSTVQFHVRDAASADEDLHSLLAGVRGDGALVFTCNGRGTRLFGRPDHDAEARRRRGRPGPSAGMFCAGEIGPVGRRELRARLHGQPGHLPRSRLSRGIYVSALRPRDARCAAMVAPR